MMKYFAAIAEPISDAAPCGPDPEADPEIQNFLATAEGQLPASFRDFKKKDFDAAGQIKQITGLLNRSRDLRLLVLAAKYFILSEDICGFADCLQAMSILVRERWEHVHPAAIDQDFALRAAYLKSLDDIPTVILPLQHAPLVKDRRLGPLSFRAHLVATKQAAARKDEEVPDAAAIRDAFLKAEDLDSLKAIFAAIAAAGSALKDIRNPFVERVGYEHAPSFDQLPALLGNIEDYLKSVLQEREPPAAPAIESETAAEAIGAPDQSSEAKPAVTGTLPPIGSVPDALEALKAIEAYYTTFEPSNPARLLIKQAHQLVGKSFVEAMQILAPELASQTSIKIRGDAPFALNFDQLSNLIGGEANEAALGAPAQTYRAATRADASRLMTAVEMYYRKQEPSSPIPLLVERARLFIDKDFSALLKEMLKSTET
jgi:type VI secretion system protein ImpA